MDHETTLWCQSYNVHFSSHLKSITSRRLIQDHQDQSSEGPNASGLPVLPPLSAGLCSLHPDLDAYHALEFGGKWSCIKSSCDYRAHPPLGWKVVLNLDKSKSEDDKSSLMCFFCPSRGLLHPRLPRSALHPKCIGSRSCSLFSSSSIFSSFQRFPPLLRWVWKA